MTCLRGLVPFITLFAFSAISSAQVDRIPEKVSRRVRSSGAARDGLHQAFRRRHRLGSDILKKGGSAVDAAIAANATLGLMEPVSNGVGGDLFAIVYSAKENKLYGINGADARRSVLSYEQMKAELNKLNRKTNSPQGMLPISVPRTVDAWAEAA